MQGAFGLKQDNLGYPLSAHADRLAFFKKTNFIIRINFRLATTGLIYLAESRMPLAYSLIFYELS
jgi:hypothetical protein